MLSARTEMQRMATTLLPYVLFCDAILECISPDIFSKGRLLANKCLKMYSELIKNPPFPAWKDGLDELWN